MSSLVQVEQQQKYEFKIMNELLVQAKAMEIDLEKLVGFLGAQVQAMLNCSPNYSMFGKKARAWIMRGFYPGTSLFFKLTIGTMGDSDSTDYYVKASGLKVTLTARNGRTHDSFVMIDSVKLNDSIVNSMENEFFGANHELQSLLQKSVKLPRCMSPRGCQIFSLDKGKK